MFDVINYARDNDVAVEIIPQSPEDGIRIRMRDTKTAAQESLLVTQKELDHSTLPDVLIEKRCDLLLDMIGKRKSAYNRFAAEAERMREREAFFRDQIPGQIELEDWLREQDGESTEQKGAAQISDPELYMDT